jgi:hypothetical protein
VSEPQTVACPQCDAQVTDLDRHRREVHAAAAWIAWAQCPNCLKILRREGLETHMKSHVKERRPRPPMLLARDAPRTPPAVEAQDKPADSHGEAERP